MLLNLSLISGQRKGLELLTIIVYAITLCAIPWHLYIFQQDVERQMHGQLTVTSLGRNRCTPRRAWEMHGKGKGRWGPQGPGRPFLFSSQVCRRTHLWDDHVWTWVSV